MHEFARGVEPIPRIEIDFGRQEIRFDRPFTCIGTQPPFDTQGFAWHRRRCDSGITRWGRGRSTPHTNAEADFVPRRANLERQRVYLPGRQGHMRARLLRAGRIGVLRQRLLFWKLLR